MGVTSPRETRGCLLKSPYIETAAEHRGRRSSWPAALVQSGESCVATEKVGGLDRPSEETWRFEMEAGWGCPQMGRRDRRYRCPGWWERLPERDSRLWAPHPVRIPEHRL